MNKETNKLSEKKKTGSKPLRQFPKGDEQIATRYILKCFISPTITEMQIKATGRYHLTPVRRLLSKGQKIATEGELRRAPSRPVWRLEQKHSLHDASKAVCQYTQNIPVIYQSTAGSGPKGSKNSESMKRLTPLLSAALVTTAKKWKQLANSERMYAICPQESIRPSKEWNPVTCDNMYDNRNQYARRNKPGTGR